MQRTPRLRLGFYANVSGAGSLIRDVRPTSNIISMTPLEEILNAKIAELERHNAALVAENAKLKGEDLIEDERRALAFIDPLIPPDEYVYADAVAKALKIEISRANWIVQRDMRCSLIVPV